MFEWVLNTPCRSYIILRTLSFSKWSFWVGICSPVFWLFLICNFRGCIWNRNAVFDWFVLGYGFILKHNSLRNLLVDGHFYSIDTSSFWCRFCCFFPCILCFIQITTSDHVHFFKTVRRLKKLKYFCKIFSFSVIVRQCWRIRYTL